MPGLAGFEPATYNRVKGGDLKPLDDSPKRNAGYSSDLFTCYPDFPGRTCKRGINL